MELPNSFRFLSSYFFPVQHLIIYGLVSISHTMSLSNSFTFKCLLSDLDGNLLLQMKSFFEPFASLSFSSLKDSFDL